MDEDALRIKKAVFFTSMKRAEDFPQENLPQIAVAGKSNAGKSSLINYLANHSRLAYVGKQPGKTRLVNFYNINDGSFWLVDLPGYGFARVSKSARDSWGKLMDAYFNTSDNIKALLILTDIRRKPTADDIVMVKYAEYYKINFAIVATKADKIAKSKRLHYARIIKDYIENQTDTKGFKVFPVSSYEKKGGEAILKYIFERLSC